MNGNTSCRIVTALNPVTPTPINRNGRATSRCLPSSQHDNRYIDAASSSASSMLTCRVNVVKSLYLTFT